MKKMILLRMLNFSLVSVLFTILCTAQPFPDDYYCQGYRKNCPNFLRPASMPMNGLQGKGDLEFGLMHSLNRTDILFSQFNSLGMDYKVAYSPVKGLGVALTRKTFKDEYVRPRSTSSVSYSPNNAYPWDFEVSSTTFSKKYEIVSKLNTIAVGYYKKFGKSIFWNSNFAYGRGKYLLERQGNSKDRFEASINTLSLSSAFSYRFTIFEVGLNYNLGFNYFGNFKGDVLHESSSQRTYISERRENLVSEYSPVITFHMKDFKLFMQYTQASNHSHSGLRMYRSVLSLGTQLIINTKRKKEEDREKSKYLWFQ